MSQYGPPGGPYPGQPQEPWATRQQPPEPYGEPSDPWGAGQSDPWAANPPSPGGYGPRYGGDPDPGQHSAGYGYGATGGHDADRPPAHHPQSGPPPTRGYEADAYPVPPSPAAQPVWAQPAPQRRRGPGAAMITVVAVLAVLVCGGLLTAIYLMGDDPERIGGTGTAGRPAATTGAPTPTGQAPESTPAPQASTDARFVRTGQCIRNEGTEAKPRMAIVDCGARTYEVLARFDGVTDGEADAKSKCAKVAGYTNWYFFNSELDTLDFVLCLKER